MPRLAGVDIPENKRIEIALTYIYGIGRATARKILEKAGIDMDQRSKDLTEGDFAKIRREIEGSFKVEGDKKREVSANIKLKMDIACYQGMRHRKSLPVRGQRTRTNSRTRKGKIKTVMGKKKPPTPK